MLEPVTINDTDTVWKLRNDVATRRELGLGVISFSECLDWVANISEGKSNERLMVAKDDKLGIVGFATFRYDGDVAHVGVSIGSAFRGNGYGKQAIKLANEYSIGKGIKKLIAKISAENYKALFAFESAGYIDTGEVLITPNKKAHFVYEWKC